MSAGPLLLCVAALAMAQQPAAPEDPAAAVRLAKAAFEYRDFKRVTQILDPWLHPPRIVDRTLEVEARELMGVSLHVLGDKKGATEEFGQLLELDPKHELDPFVVPPVVIQTFEEVRAKMKPRLDAVGPDRTPPVTGPPEIREVATVHPALALLPFGTPQFLADQPGRGALWAGLQVAFLALNVIGYRLARLEYIENKDNKDENGAVIVTQAFRTWTGLQYAGIVGFAGTWATSSALGYQTLSAQREAALAPPPAPGPAAQLRLSWSF
ncbi:MAG: hypothetical protein KC933_30665 [Myxococcales bacterium]|nr:hypothetical protein [Myxococcales bacterium]MCB9650716.1 hypothetical protein [Deltaproteobacteria bacterium]